MSEHTPEPWVAAPEELNEDWVHIWGASELGTADSWVGQIHGKPERSRADALRIVACVNACEGMADPAQEISVLRARAEKAEAALRYYADARLYLSKSAISQCRRKGLIVASIYADRGKVAREALAGKGEQ